MLTEHMSVVAVRSEDEDNAANVFETLNDRGIGLSTPDLLRNLLLRRADNAHRDEIVDCWRSVLEIEEDAKVDDFLRHYWLSHNGDVKTRGLYREIKTTVLRKDRSSLDFSRDLRRTASIYRELVTGRDENDELRHLLLSIDALGAKLLVPAILSAYDVGNLENKQKFLRTLLTLYVRHNVIGNLENSQLETLVFDVARKLRSNSDFSAATARIERSAPQDDEFIEQFKIARISRQKTARYILRELEHAKRRTYDELGVSSPDRVHVEHIYPQKPESTWEDHNSIVNRLGNLTLLARKLNQNARNSAFAIKKPYYEQSELLLTKELVNYGNWNQSTIDQRQADLSSYATSIWAFG